MARKHVWKKRNNRKVIEVLVTHQITEADIHYLICHLLFEEKTVTQKVLVCDTQQVADFKTGYYRGAADFLTLKTPTDPVQKSLMLATETGTRRLKFLLMFCAGEMLSGVDLELRRAVKELMLENRYLGQCLIESNYEEAKKEYWENWANL